MLRVRVDDRIAGFSDLGLDRSESIGPLFLIRCRVFGCLIGRPGRATAPLLMLVNGEGRDVDFMLPGGVWQAVFDSTHPRGKVDWNGQGPALNPLPGGSVVVLAAAGHDLDL